MKFFGLLTLTFGLTFISCNPTKADKETVNSLLAEDLNDKEEIQNLIRQVLNWSESKNSFELLPYLTDSKDSVCIGFDLNKLRANLDKLRATNFFAAEFIENYNQIILTLDKKLRNKEFEDWRVGDLPTFPFANDVNVWCMCQDVPYDKPNPWDLIEVEIINLNNKSGELLWKWGKPELNGNPDWKAFSYKFKVVKENDKWKIAYMEGFDFKESTRSDGVWKHK